MKNLPGDAHLPKRLRKSWKVDFRRPDWTVQFPENWFGIHIIWNDFWSSWIWAIQIKVSKTELKNPKIPGIQPKDILEKAALWFC